MTTPTPRTDALLKDERHNTVAETRYWLDQLKTLARQLERDLAARDAELAAMKQRAEEYWRERDAARDHADHEQRRANRAEERAEAAEQERDSAVSWNHRVSVCEKHTAEIVDGPCVICELEAAERKAEEAAMAIDRARRVMGGEGVEDQGQAWDQCLRILDAAIAAQIMGHLAGLERRHDFTQEEDALYALEAADALIAAHNEEAA